MSYSNANPMKITNDMPYVTISSGGTVRDEIASRETNITVT